MKTCAELILPFSNESKLTQSKVSLDSLLKGNINSIINNLTKCLVASTEA